MLAFGVSLTFAIPQGGSVNAKTNVGPVVVFLSNNEAAYTVPLNTFRNEIGLDVKIFNLRGDLNAASKIMDKIFATKPSLIFALGAKAAYVAKSWTKERQNIPVIFAMVLNWERYKLTKGQSNVAGISGIVEPGTQFINLSMISPTIKKIGIVYSQEHSTQSVQKALKAAKLLGIQVVAKPIRHPNDFRSAYESIADRIQALWIPTDPIVYTVKNMAYLEKRCVNDRIACIGQSENVARLGIFLAVNPDNSSVGSQAVFMAKRILFRNQSPKNIGVQAPVGTNLFINVKAAKKIGLALKESVLNMATDLIQ